MKTKQILIALGALLVVAGCSRKDLNPELKTVRLSAQVESGQTRATVDGTTGAFAWESGDVLSIYLSTGSGAFQNVTLDNAAGNFVMTAAAAAARTGYSVFPSSLNPSWDGSTLSVTLPASYSITSATSVKTPLPMVAVNDPTSDFLFFRHVGALIRIENLSFPAGTTQATVTFNNKGVQGTFEVNTEGIPTILNVDAASGNNVVTFNISGSPLPTVLNIPVPCGAYYGLTVTGNSGSYSVSFTDENFTLARHEGKKLTAPDPEPVP